jgi:hypothetical protein
MSSILNYELGIVNSSRRDVIRNNSVVVNPNNNFIPFQSLVFSLESMNLDLYLERMRGTDTRSFGEIADSISIDLFTGNDECWRIAREIHAAIRSDKPLPSFGTNVYSRIEEYSSTRDYIAYNLLQGVFKGLSMFFDIMDKDTPYILLDNSKQTLYGSYIQYESLSNRYLNTPGISMFNYRNNNSKLLCCYLGGLSDIEKVEVSLGDGLTESRNVEKILSILVVKREWIPNVILSLMTKTPINPNAFGIIEDVEFDTKEYWNKGLRTWYRKMKRTELNEIPVIKDENIYEKIVYQPKKDEDFKSVGDMDDHSDSLLTDFIEYDKYISKLESVEVTAHYPVGTKPQEEVSQIALAC